MDFFLLRDLVTDDYSAVKFFSSFEDFKASPVPASIAEYLDYRELAMGFLEARNQRIQDWSRRQAATTRRLGVAQT